MARQTFASHGLRLCIGERSSQGWVYEPVLGTTVTGSRGEGVLFDGNPVRLNERKRTDEVIGTAARYLFERAEQRTDVIQQIYRPNCAGHEYVLILSGERSFSAYTKLLPWDHVRQAASLSARLGGFSALLDHGVYDLAHPKRRLCSRRRVPEMWHNIRDDPRSRGRVG